MIGYTKWLLQSFNRLSCLLKGNLNHRDSSEKHVNQTLNMDVHLTSQYGSGAGGGTRAGLFRTPISGGVQSATSAHGLPRPALAVRNLMEQVDAIVSCLPTKFIFFLLIFCCIIRDFPHTFFYFFNSKVLNAFCFLI